MNHDLPQALRTWVREQGVHLLAEHGIAVWHPPFDGEWRLLWQAPPFMCALLGPGLSAVPGDEPIVAVTPGGWRAAAAVDRRAELMVDAAGRLATRVAELLIDLSDALHAAATLTGVAEDVLVSRRMRRALMELAVEPVRVSYAEDTVLRVPQDELDA